MILSNYAPGSMVGSGIYSDDWSEDRYCVTCEADRPGIMYRNDWGTHYWQCDHCEVEVEVDLADDFDDSVCEPDDHLDDSDF